jgi:hypothetical protein
MHAGELLCDRMLRAIFLLRQPLDPPDLGKKLADLFKDRSPMKKNYKIA